MTLSQRLNWWTWAVPLAALSLVAAKFADLLHIDTPVLILIAGIVLLGAVFSAVHHAELIALKVGEPFGSLILAIAVTVIEVALIVSIMLSAPASTSSLARDTVSSAVAIVLNGVIGLCLVIGGARYREQEFQVKGTASSLSVLATLAVLTLVMPNFTTARLGPQYSPTQLIFVGCFSLILYGVFVFVQSVRHRDYFLAEALGAEGNGHGGSPPSAAAALASCGLLLASLVAVVLLAKTLSPPLEAAVAAAGLPNSFIGVVIAGLVLLPESLAAILAAKANHIQTSLNLALGSAIASIGLTIPVVAAVSLYLGQDLVLGLDPEGMALLLLTLFASTLTLGTGRATILQGAVHLVIFGLFILLSAVP